MIELRKFVTPRIGRYDWTTRVRYEIRKFGNSSIDGDDDIIKGKSVRSVR